MNIEKKLVTVLNLAIVAVALTLGGVVVKKYLLTAPPTKLPELPPIVVGTHISIPDVVWSRSRKTMVVALHEQCPFCTQSAPFYKRLIEKANASKNFQLIAVLPHDPGDSRKYLDSLGVAFNDVKYSELRKIGVSATPTLLLLDGNGAITASWVGALSVDQENEVLRRIGDVALN